MLPKKSKEFLIIRNKKDLLDSRIENQLFMGKDPDYDYAVNPINPGLGDFGSDLSILCKTHYTPVDKVQIEKGRING